MKEYYKQLYAKKFDDLDVNDRFHERYKLSKFIQEEMDNLNILYLLNKWNFRLKISTYTNKIHNTPPLVYLVKTFVEAYLHILMEHTQFK